MQDDHGRSARYTDRMLIRGKDIGLIVGIMTLATVVYAMVKKPTQWDDTTHAVERLEPIVSTTKTRVDILEGHYDDILRRLDSIDRKMDKVRE